MKERFHSFVVPRIRKFGQIRPYGDQFSQIPQESKNAGYALVLLRLSGRGCLHAKFTAVVFHYGYRPADYFPVALRRAAYGELA